MPNSTSNCQLNRNMGQLISLMEMPINALEESYLSWPTFWYSWSGRSYKKVSFT